MKKLLCAALIAILLVSSALAVGETRNLVVLGDSIATGYGLSGYGAGGVYACSNFGLQLARAAGLAPKTEFVNFAQDGMDTLGLYEKLGDAQVSSRLASADAVVVSIGANDILGLGLQVMKTALGLSPDASNEQLVNAIKNTPDALEKITRALIANKAQFEERAAGFDERLNRTLKRLRQVNPRANLYVLSLYNPLGISALSEAGAFLDGIFLPMNTAIAASRADFAYAILPVGESFRRNTSAYTNIDSFDVHPSQSGHNLIFRLASAAMGLNSPSAVTSINIKKSSLKLAAGSAATLKCVVKPASAGTAVWSSSNESVATVDENGTVTATGKGAAYVWAKLRSNPRISDKCKIVVTGAEAGYVSFSPRAIAPSNSVAKNGAIEIIPAGGSGKYDISVDGGRTFAKTSVAGTVKINKLSSGVYDVLVKDSSDETNKVEKRVILGYKMIKPRLRVESSVPVRLVWSGMGDGYEVWRQSSGAYEMIGVCESLSFTDVEAERGSVYRYKVRAIGPDGAKSAFGNAVKVKPSI